ncbi:E3 ubiquitin-protein ligase RNF25 [Anopheles maculipalpis]|uniref:E3 ubiquitin-protein ligase RNF25 n=1 Tax=Anopheles maculipalpis TaxID=1496333 RepID=UPI00215988EC|nr:E3 ubiquitin-protein ligase RNF25 [Anopheles maculipalpis]
MDALLDEVESLEAILMEDVHITKDASGFPEMIETTVFPTVGEELESQYVCITLQVLPTVGYPDVRPNVKLRNPRGLDDSIIGQIERAVQAKLQESIGQPVVFDLIDLIREQLTESNLPSGQCVICLYGFLEGDEFTKTVCYHYLHSHCLACHINASKRNYEEEIEKLPIWKRKEAKAFQAQCPVCREPIDVEVEPLMRCRPPTERENAPKFQVTDELKSLQAQMNRLFMHQKRRGGIIDLDAEEGNVIAIETESLNREISKGTSDASNGPNAVIPEVKTPANKKHGSNAHPQQQAKGSSSSKAANNTARQRNSQSATTTANGEANDDPDACTESCCSGQTDHHRGGGYRNRRHNNHHHNRHHRHHHHHQHHHHHHQHQGRGGGAGAGGAGTSTAAAASSGGAAKNLGTPCASDAR